jgi:hypothetical protein
MHATNKHIIVYVLNCDDSTVIVDQTTLYHCVTQGGTIESLAKHFNLKPKPYAIRALSPPAGSGGGGKIT